MAPPLPKDAPLEALVDEGLRLIAERLAKSPDFGLFQSVQKQLEFIKETLTSGKRPSAADKDRLTIGVLAAREFEDNDPDLADVLFRVSYAFTRL